MLKLSFLVVLDNGYDHVGLLQNDAERQQVPRNRLRHLARRRNDIDIDFANIDVVQRGSSHRRIASAVYLLVDVHHFGPGRFDKLRQRLLLRESVAFVPVGFHCRRCDAY